MHFWRFNDVTRMEEGRNGNSVTHFSTHTRYTAVVNHSVRQERVRNSDVYVPLERG